MTVSDLMPVRGLGPTKRKFRLPKLDLLSRLQNRILRPINLESSRPRPTLS